MRRRTLVLAAIPILLTPLAGCPSEEEEEETPTQGEVETPDGPLSGELDVGAWEIPEDLAVEVVGDLVVRSSAAIRVDGELRAAAGSGFTIILDAADTLTVAGTVAAGDGADGELGGAVVLAAGSDVVLEAGAEVAAGSGGDGIVDEDTLGQAADGGDVSFLAGGTLDIDPAATVTIGDGGDGAELRVQPDDLPDPETWNVLRAPNGGGASGGLELAFGDTTLAVTVHESGEAIVRDDGSVLVEEDEPFLELDESSEGIFGGGEAGDPGAFLYGDDADGESNWPGGEASITEWVDDGRDTPQPKEIVGQNGRPAMSRGGAGAPATWTGKNGAAPGDDGQGVYVSGGRGGDCGVRVTRITYENGQTVMRFTYVGKPGCTPGAGGAATARGGNGADGSAATKNGGAGGFARAAGGVAGWRFTRPGGVTTRTAVAACGSASAYGGTGGRGWGDCEGEYDEAGGTGGDGGSAYAYANGGGYLGEELTPSPCGSDGTATAEGGTPGRGGDASATPGAGGVVNEVAAVPGTPVEPDPGAPGSICSVIVVPDCFELPTIPSLEDPLGDGFNPAVPGSYFGWESQALPGETDLREVSGCVDLDFGDPAAAVLLVQVELEAHLGALAPDEGYLDVVVTSLDPYMGSDCPALPELPSSLLWVEIPAAEPLAAEVHRFEAGLFDAGTWVADAGAEVWDVSDGGPGGTVLVQVPLGALFATATPDGPDPSTPLGLAVVTRLHFGPDDVNVDVAPDPAADGVLDVVALPAVTDEASPSR